jgi:predicted amidohydrolase
MVGRGDKQPSDDLTLGLVQMRCPLSDPDGNIERAEQHVRAAAELGCDLVVLPEFFNTGYFPIYWDAELIRLAEPAGGPTLTRMRRLAGELGIHIVACIYEAAAPGHHYDTAFLLDPGGELAGHYRKTHAPARLSLEKIYFKPGCSYPVFRLGPWTVGLAICYDMYFPESARALAVGGAELIVAPFADVALPLWTELFRVRAFENITYVAACNMVGTEGTQPAMPFGGQSLVVAPTGELLVRGDADAEDVLVATLRRADLVEARRARHLWRDRNPSAYGPLLASPEPDLSGAFRTVSNKETHRW